MARYTIDEVHIEGGFPVEEILELSMDIGVNAHGILTYGGFVDASAAKYIQQSADRQIIKVYLRDKLEFCGYPQEITLCSQHDHHYLRARIVSATQFMDILPRNRFFQDTDRSFADIITEAYEASGIGNLLAIRGRDAITKPILQYRETDWQFTLRMAGRLGTVVIPDVTSAEPYAALGIPNSPVRSEPGITAHSTGCVIDHRNVLHHETESVGRYRLGDSIGFGGEALFVARKSFRCAQGEIVEHYIFGHEQEFSVPYHKNKCITGLELPGKVLDRTEQEMRVLLDIDADRTDDGKTWFYYAPCTNNGMYSMPLKDEKVMLQWQSASDEEILIVRPSRQNGYAMPDPSERHFLTEHEAHLKMIPGTVEYKNPIGNITWLKSRGFNIISGKKISVSAGEDIKITSGRQVRVYSPERISACKAGAASSIDMQSNELHIKAVANVKSTSKANKYKKTTLPKRVEKTEIDATTASKLAAAVPHTSNVLK